MNALVVPSLVTIKNNAIVKNHLGVSPNLMVDLGAWQAQRGCLVGVMSIFTSIAEPMPSLLLAALDITALQSAPGISLK